MDHVDQRWRMPSRGVDLERWFITTLNAHALGSVVASGVGRITLSQRRTPWWTVVLAVIAFPLGLLFLLVKAEQHLTVMITPDEGVGSRIDLVGMTRASTFAALTERLVTEQGADARPVSARI